MIRLDDVQPDALPALRDVGYDPKTEEEALDAAMRYLGCSTLSASVFLTGESDRVELRESRPVR
jgi:hypothetical protein